MKNRILLAMITASTCASILAGSPARAATDRIAISLKEAEIAALSASHRVAAARSELEAAQARSASQGSLLWPRLSLEASYRYVSVVPELSLVPGGRTLSFGANSSYSVGPALQWTLLDFGATSSAVESTRQLERAKEEELRFTRRQTLLATRTAYFRLQLALEQMRSVADALRLAESQNRDIGNRLKAGVSSRIDAISAHREVLSLQVQFRQSQAEVAASLRELFTLTGQHGNTNLSHPLDARLANAPPGARASVWVSTEEISHSKSRFSAATGTVADHPQLRALEYQAESARQAAATAKAGHYPKVQLLAKTSLDYPNGPVLEQIHQNTVGVTLSMPLFESGKTSNEARERGSLAEAIGSRRAQTELDLEKDRRKALDQLEALQSQQSLLENAAEEARELSSLVYGSYRAGRSSFIELQNANFRALEANVQLSRNRVQILLQLALIASMGGDE